MLSTNLSGKYGWIAYHERLFGRDRLKNSLFPSLSTSPRHIAVVRLSHELYKASNDIVSINGLTYKRWILPFTYRIHVISDFNVECSSITSISINDVYFMDAASIIVSCLLKIDKNPSILDLCSAPGGKSLILIRILEDLYYDDSKDFNCKVICNEFNKNRFERLKKVLFKHVGDLNMKRLNVKTVSVDATSSSLFFSLLTKFSSIILDAPCSSDRHLILSDSLQNWSLRSAKENFKRQISILKNALTLLEENGTLLYCTCTLNEKENDDVIEYICNKTGINADSCLLSLISALNEFSNTYNETKISIQPISKNYTRETIKISKDGISNENFKNQSKIVFEYSRFGAYILPDNNDGIGPLYVSIINKPLC